MTQAALDRPSTSALALGLGWFSLGLGTAELLAPKAVSKFLGMNDGTYLIQSYGLREIAAGVGILTSENPQPWLISRIGGDVIDIATLVANFGKDNAKNANVAVALGAVLGATAADIVCAQSMQKHNQRLAKRQKEAARDYSRRSGFSKPAHEMRGAAIGHVHIPEDFRTPEALRPLNAA
jgi:hypothetical protein